MPAKPSATAAASRVAAVNGAAHSRTNGAVAARTVVSSAAPTKATDKAAAPKAEPKILFQKMFKSVGPRTYSAHVKECPSGNQFLVLTEGKRDVETGEIKKTKVFVYSEDFAAYFRMLHETAQFIKAHPVSEAIKMKRMRHWAKKEAEAATAAREAAAAVKPIVPTKIAPAKVVAGKPSGSNKAAARKPSRGR